MVAVGQPPFRVASTDKGLKLHLLVPFFGELLEEFTIVERHGHHLHLAEFGEEVSVLVRVPREFGRVLNLDAVSCVRYPKQVMG